jgi:hypothetical protein
MLSIRLFDNHTPLPFMQAHGIKGIVETIGGRLVAAGEATFEGHHLLFVEARSRVNTVQGLWLDDGASVAPMTFRIFNGPERDTGWCEPNIIAEEYREVAHALRLAMSHGGSRFVQAPALALTA